MKTRFKTDPDTASIRGTLNEILNHMYSNLIDDYFGYGTTRSSKPYQMAWEWLGSINGGSVA